MSANKVGSIPIFFTEILNFQEQYLNIEVTALLAHGTLTPLL